MDNLNMRDILTGIGVLVLTFGSIFFALYAAIKADESKQERPVERQSTMCTGCGNPHPHSYQSGRYYCHECGIDW